MALLTAGRSWRRAAGCSLAVGLAVLAVLSACGVSQADVLPGSGHAGRFTATSPPSSLSGAMAYDAATQTVVLFKGSYPHGQTWTWNGSTWTRQHPAAE